MTREEIERHLNAGRARSVRVDVSNTPEYPGFVRTITIYDGNVVTVEFNAHGYDEGGAVFKATFGSLDEAIGAVEHYLGRPLADWVNFSRGGEYPEPMPYQDLDEGQKRLVEAIATNRVRLPPGEFTLNDDGFWSKSGS